MLKQFDIFTCIHKRFINKYFIDFIKYAIIHLHIVCMCVVCISIQLVYVYLCLCVGVYKMAFIKCLQNSCDLKT